MDNDYIDNLDKNSFSFKYFSLIKTSVIKNSGKKLKHLIEMGTNNGLEQLWPKLNQKDQ